MPLADSIERSRAVRSMILLLILAAAAVARFWGLGTGIPFAVGIDEPQVVGRALAILHTGDWNTHLFDYPTLVIYLQATVAIVRFLWGAIRGEWASLDAFNIASVYMTGRIVAASIGVATVWLTYRLGRSLAAPGAALLAAAIVAVGPSNVRESHFILTDVPTTALTTAAVWLSVRAARKRTIGAYAWAGALCGLSAGAKYTGGVAIVAAATAWVIHERSSADRWMKAAALVLAAAFAFFIAAPYTILDLPGFLDGFAHQFARFAAHAPAGAEPGWLTYLKHLSLIARWRVPLAVTGILILLWRRETRIAWAPPIVFCGVYFYALSTHRPIFARYALPLGPMISLFMSIAALAIVGLSRRVQGLRRAWVQRLAYAAAVLLLVTPPLRVTVQWLAALRHPDTRVYAAQWLQMNAPAGARVAVENSGPTNLGAAGFHVVATLVLLDRPPDWYRPRADYLIVSAGDLARYGGYLSQGPIVFQIAPTPQRWGPPITVIKVSTAARPGIGQ